MLTKTTRSAVRLLTRLARADGSESQSPRRVAERIGESPSYLTKVAQRLAEARVVRARRGRRGGIVLQQDPRQLTLLTIADACQGPLLAENCPQWHSPQATCAIHQACFELHQTVRSVLHGWTLVRLAEVPGPRDAEK